MFENKFYEKRVFEADSSHNEVQQNKEPHTRTMKSWRHKQTFESETEANTWLEEEACWSKQKNYEVSAGRKQLFRCNRVPSRGVQCEAAIYLLYSADNLQVILYSTEADHNHNDILDQVKKVCMNKATKDLIDLLIRQKVAPKNILDILAKETLTNTNIRVPSERQLYNYAAAKRKKEGPSQMNFDELSQWCNSNRNIPEDFNDPFVVSYQINIDGEDPEYFPGTVDVGIPVA